MPQLGCSSKELMQKEGSQFQKVTYCTVPFIGHSQNMYKRGAWVTRLNV